MTTMNACFSVDMEVYNVYLFISSILDAMFIISTSLFKGPCTRSMTFSYAFFRVFFHFHLPFLSKCLLRMWKHRKSNLIQIFGWWTKVSETVCKCDWHNVRSYLFLKNTCTNFRWEFQTQCAKTLRQVISHSGHLWNASQAQLLSLWMGKCKILQNCWPSLRLNFTF